MAFEVNERGLAEIREILSEHHKSWAGMNPGDIPSETVFAYASDAEQYETGSFEIGGLHSVTGNPQVFYISDTGIDV